MLFKVDLTKLEECVDKASDFNREIQSHSLGVE